MLTSSSYFNSPFKGKAPRPKNGLEISSALKMKSHKHRQATGLTPPDCTVTGSKLFYFCLLVLLTSRNLSPWLKIVLLVGPICYIKFQGFCSYLPVIFIIKSSTKVLRTVYQRHFHLWWLPLPSAGFTRLTANLLLR